MEKYIDNYGNAIEADYLTKLPIENHRQDTQIEELWRRLSEIYGSSRSSKEKRLLRELLGDMEHWMEANPIKSPKRWATITSEVSSTKSILNTIYTDNQGNEIEADHGFLPVANNKGDLMYEELWRRIQHIESMTSGRFEKEKLQDLLMDIEYWLSNDPILLPLRGSLANYEWKKEKEARIKKRKELDRLVAIGDKSAIASFYRKNGVWYSTEKLT